ncbi:MAG: DUF4278 domain-containing protein [Cyanobacteria bacterium J06638_7]
MNVLDLIRSKIVKEQRLNAAQFLMAKSYRGVPYVDAHHDDPAQTGKTEQLTYRGVPYVDAHHDDPAQTGKTKRLTYRGQSYED